MPFKGRHRAARRPLIRASRMIAATAALTLLAASGVVASLPATAAPGDRTAAEGALLAGGGAINIDAIAELGGAYSNFGPGIPDSVDLDLTALSLLNINLEDLLTLSLGDLVELGVVGQYASADATGAVSSSGAVSETGLIDAGAGADPANNSRVTLTPLLEAAGVDAVISDLRLELGALSARAEATRDAAAPFASEYQVAGADLVIASPAIGQLTSTLNTTVGGLDSAVNALAGPGGLNSVVGSLITGLEPVLAVLGPVADINVDQLTIAVSVDLQAALANLLTQPLVDDNGTVTIDLTTGTIRVDLATLYDLNDMPVNSELLDSTTLNSVVGAIIEDLLLNELPKRVLDMVEDTLNSTSAIVSLGVEADALFGLVPLAVIDLELSTTLGGLLGLEGAPAATHTISGSVLGLPLLDFLGQILNPLLSLVTDTVGGVLRPILELNTLTGQVGTLVAGTVTALDPVFDLVSQVASVRVNVQESPGAFREGTVEPSLPSFTQRAVQVQVLPGILNSLTTVNLASASVAALPLAIPVPSAITPDRGPVGGGTVVTITGSGFTDAMGVVFDGTSGTVFTVVSDTEITVTTPPGTAGAADVVVQHPDGSASAGTFIYQETTITGVIPDEGPAAGGTVVEISGACFTGATAVTFGGVAGTDFQFVSDTLVRVTTPAGTGMVDVTVVGADCGDATSEDAFAYVAPGAPDIITVSPQEGPITGGTVVTITGSGFTDATGVTFDGNAGTSFTVDSDTQITVTTPPGAAVGSVPVVVADPSGDSAPLAFEYTPATTIDTVAPDRGPETGGTTVTITGSCFTGATDVLFGTTSAASFTVVNDTTITAVAPAGSASVVDVTVVGAPGCGNAVDEDAYTYQAVPVIGALTPDSGPETGGTLVTITGSGFTGATAVTFAGVPSAGVVVISDTEVRALSPAGAVGPADVVVTTPVAPSAPQVFTYTAAPVAAVASSLTPATGPETGGTAVTITGSGLTGATGVTFDGNAGTDFTVVSDTEITVTSPAGTRGDVDVVVLDPAGDSAALTFTYVGQGVIDEVSPPTGPEAGGNTVTITGSCFVGATDVLFGTTPATSFTVVSDTEITAVAPAGVGTVDVTVVTAPACDDVTDPDGYTYVAVPVITTVAPDNGPETGGTVVTIVGTDFTDATSVTFDGVAGTDFSVVSDTEIRVTTPAGTPGVAEVIVEKGTVTSAPATFTYTAVTSIDEVTPDSGPQEGGTTVTIVGSCFTDATQVLFGDTPATSFTVLDDSRIQAVAPAGAGTVDITVVGAAGCGTGVAEGGFRYLAVILPLTGSEPLLAVLAALLLMASGAVLTARARRQVA